MKNIAAFIPVKPSELGKFLSISFIMVLTLYIYTILRGTKDALILDNLGPEMLSTLKLFGVLPSAIIMMLCYTKMADYLTRVSTYHIINCFFISFFVLFDFVLYPNAQNIHYDFGVLAEEMPYLKYKLLMIGNWSFSLFYIMSELWGSIMLALMFWQLANQISTTDEAKRFYPLFGFIGQIGMILAGTLLKVFTNTGASLDWATSLHYIVISVIIAGLLLSATLFSLGRFVVGNEVINGSSAKKRKEKPGLIKSLKEIFASKYIGLITLLILCYGISINLVEGVWKSQLKEFYQTATNIANFTGSVQIYTGVATFIAMLIGSYALRVFSWRTVAIATPVIILLTGVPFFIFVIFNQSADSMLSLTGTHLIFIAVIFGAVQNILSKAIKYSFFDPTKEMAYIPLDEDLKAKGKAAADVIGGRLGKSGGAIIQWAMLTSIAGSTLMSLAPFLCIIFIVILAIWFFAVFRLSTEYTKKIKD